MPRNPLPATALHAPITGVAAIRKWFYMAKSTPVSPFSFSLVNITLVMFFLSVFSFVALAFHTVVEQAKTEQEYKIVLAEHVSEEKGRQMTAQFAEAPFALAARYISKDEALLKFKEDAGEEFAIAMDGENPLPAVIAVNLRSEYANVDSVNDVSRKLLRNQDIKEIDYPLLVIATVNNRAELMRVVAAGLGLMLLIVSFFLIRNTVKLAIFSRRLVIRTMQLVGATESFIRRPYVRLGTLQGIMGAGFALAMLACLVLATDSILDAVELPVEIGFLLYTWEMRFFYAAIFIFGALIGYFSSLSAVNRFMNRPLDAVA